MRKYSIIVIFAIIIANIAKINVDTIYLIIAIGYIAYSLVNGGGEK